MRAKFPAYNYDDMVEAQHRLIAEGLGIRHLRLVLGNSMERALRQSLMMSQGDLTALVQRPISAAMLGIAAVILLIPLIGRFNKARVRAITENG